MFRFTETPIPAQHCPRQNGYFSHEDEKECGKFYYCVDGKFNMITCPDGLVYNDKSGICTWPDEAKKKGCGAAGMYYLLILTHFRRLVEWAKRF